MKIFLILSFLLINSIFNLSIFQLSAKDPKTITNLIKGEEYYFLIKSEKFQKITFNIVMNNTNVIPFGKVVFNEYDYKGIQGNNPEKASEKKISFSSSQNQIISTFSYIVSKYFTRETALKIIPNNNINYMNIKIEQENTYYDFHFKKQTIYNLTVGNKYYFHKHTYGQEVSRLYLDLMMDYIDNNPFESIKVYEYKMGLFEYDNKNESKINYADIKTKI